METKTSEQSETSFVGRLISIFKKIVPVWAFKLVGLKFIFQIIYLVFILNIARKFEVAEYGVFSYVAAITVYFSTAPLLGLSTYLQRHIARKEDIQSRSFILSMYSMFAGLIIAFCIMPDLMLLHKFLILIIIISNAMGMVLTSIYDGLGKYVFQYKFMFLSHIWMIICIIQSIVLNKSIKINVQTVINYWSINVIMLLPICIFLFIKERRTISKIISKFNIAYIYVLLDLMLLCGVNILDSFGKFFDRYLAGQYLSKEFLGYYSFNLMAVTGMYGLFITPILNVLRTQVSKPEYEISDLIRIIKKFYLFGLSIYSAFFLGYIFFAEFIFTQLGLLKYIGTNSVFVLCFVNAVFYMVSIPFMTLIMFGKSVRKKVIYCFFSFMVFCIPYFAIRFNPTEKSFFSGFILASLLNLIISFLIEFKVGCGLFLPNKIRNGNGHKFDS